MHVRADERASPSVEGPRRVAIILCDCSSDLFWRTRLYDREIVDLIVCRRRSGVYILYLVLVAIRGGLKIVVHPREDHRSFITAGSSNPLRAQNPFSALLGGVSHLIFLRFPS